MKKLRITVEGKTYEVEVEILGSRIASVAPAAAPAPVASAPVSAPVAAPAPAPKKAAPAPAPKKAAPAPAGANDIVCPLAAVVVAVNVKEGQQVKAGDLLVTLEAMKMNTPVNSPADGTVSKICVSAGQSVNEGEVLLSLS